jgi:thioredoxin-related protein
MGKNKSNTIVTKKDNSKLVNICVIIGIVFLIASLALMFTNGKKDDNHIVEIDYNKYSEIIRENKYNIILLTSPTCTHCLNYKPYVNYIAGENDLTVYNLNLNTLEYDQYIEIHDMYTATKDQYGENNVPGIPTPVTIITKNGVEVTSILGNIGQSGFEKLLRNNGVIK